MPAERFSASWSIPLITGGVSLLLSLWIWVTNDAINVDGIHYVEMAERIKEIGVHFQEGKAMWFYAIIVGLASKISGISAENTAYLINAIFTSIALSVFSVISLQISGSKAIAIAASVLVLLNPHLNEYRAYVIRDPGYWMFYMFSLFYMVTFVKTGEAKHAMLWAASLFFAALFRVEAIIYAITIPLLFLFQPSVEFRVRLKQIVWCYALPAVFLLLFVLFSALDLVSFSFHGANYFHQGNKFVALFNELSSRADLLNHAVFNGMSEKQSFIALMAALLVIVVYKIVSIASPLTFALSLYTAWIDWVQMYRKYMVIIWYALLSFLVLYGFVLHQYFLQGRYALSLTFCLTLVAAGGLAYIYSGNITKSRKASKIIQVAVTIWLAFMLLDGMWSFGTRKHYIKEAGNWVQQNIPHEAKIYSNHPVLFYYTGRSQKEQADISWQQLHQQIEQGRISDTVSQIQGYMALQIDRKETGVHETIIATGNAEVLSQFSNKRGDRAYIYLIVGNSAN